MKKVQILGPSYSGSTALGFMLNTKENWLFGSEVYRFLKQSREDVESKTGKSDYVPGCTVCGKKCELWTPELRKEILKSDVRELKELYEIIEKNDERLACFVDGSKALKWYKGSLGDYGIIACKHPLRLMASYFYNERNKFSVSGDLFSDINGAICNDLGVFLNHASEKLKSYINIYNKCLLNFDDGFICRVDELHVNDFEGFSELCVYLEENPDGFSPSRFSEYSAHPVGGNKAPHWQFLKDQNVSGKEKVRHDYYSAAGAIGDYKLDNKFKQILPLEFIDEVCKFDEYIQLCALLGYGGYPSMGVN